MTPRLLPVTICVMAALLTVKSVSLVRAAMAASEAPAAAAASQAPAAAAASQTPAAAVEKPTEKAAEKPAQKPGDKPGEKIAESVPEKPSAPPLPALETPTAPLAQPVSDSERALLLDLRRRREQIDSREAAVAAREAVLGGAEARLGARLDQLGDMQRKLETLEAARRAHDEANWTGLVKLYETMKPRDAAVIFNDLDMAVLLPVVDRMKDGKAAQILAAMQPERARQVTSELAQLRARATAAPGAAPGGTSGQKPAG